MSLTAWAIYDDAGVPLTGVVPVFVDYRDRAGVARAQPAIVELGAGQYGFDSTADDASTGTAFLVDNGSGANPRRVAGAVTTGSLPFSVWHLEDDVGTLWAGAAPTVGSYTSLGGALASPGIVAVTAYLFALTPTASDATTGVTFRADSASGAWPLFVQDALVASSAPELFAAAFNQALEM